MNYIFDICLNFNNELYDFYEWDKNDNIEFYLKIPIFKVEEDIINDFVFHDIKIDNIFLKKIYNKSQKYYKNTVRNNRYSCIFSSNNKCIAVNFDDNGNIIGKSNLSLEEESEVLEFSKFLKYSIIDYKTIKKNQVFNKYLTRNELNKISLLNNYILKLFDNKNYDELEYLYYELYSDKTSDYNIIKQKLLSLINNSDKKREKIFELYNLVYK